MNYTITLTQQQVMVLVPLASVYVVANFKETAQTYPVWSAIKVQVQQQDDANAIQVVGPV